MKGRMKKKPFPHKDSPSIDKVHGEQEAAMKGFKGGRPVESEWLTKRKPVRQAIDKPYKPYTP